MYAIFQESGRQCLDDTRRRRFRQLGRPGTIVSLHQRVGALRSIGWSAYTSPGLHRVKLCLPSRAMRLVVAVLARQALRFTVPTRKPYEDGAYAAQVCVLKH